MLITSPKIYYWKYIKLSSAKNMGKDLLKNIFILHYDSMIIAKWMFVFIQTKQKESPHSWFLYIIPVYLLPFRQKH